MPKPTKPSAMSIKMPGSGTCPVDAWTLLWMAVGKSLKLFTARTQGLEVMGLGGDDPSGKKVPQLLQGPLTGENTKLLRADTSKLPMASAVSASIPAALAAMAALMAA